MGILQRRLTAIRATATGCCSGGSVEPAREWCYMVTITFDSATEWPLQCEAKQVDPALLLTKTVKTVTATEDDLELIGMEITGLPMPRHRNEWSSCTWYWTDAQFIVANIQQAYKVNKEATR